MLALVARMIVAMVVVVTIMWFAARVMRTRVMGNAKNVGAAPPIQVVARQSLSKSATIIVARIGTKHIVLGVTDQNITKLDELDIVNLADSPFDQSILETGLIDDKLFQHGLVADWTTQPGNEHTVGSGQSRKGMIEQLRELTARRA